MTSLAFHFADARRKFSQPLLERIKQALFAAADEVVPLLAIGEVDVVVVPGRDTVPGSDTNGFAHCDSRISIVIDPELAAGEIVPLEMQLKSTLAHELAHCKRMRDVIEPESLGSTLVFEGLASCFEIEAGCPLPDYACALSEDALTRFATRRTPS